MPIKRCALSGKEIKGKSAKGFKFGDSGKCYPTRKQALTQMRAIKASEYREKEKYK